MVTAPRKVSSFINVSGGETNAKTVLEAAEHYMMKLGSVEPENVRSNSAAGLEPSKKCKYSERIGKNVEDTIAVQVIP